MQWVPKAVWGKAALLSFAFELLIMDAFGWGGLFQAQVLVCRALSNILLLPWPNLPENEQQWTLRSMNHTSLISALSRDYRNLKPNAVASQRKMPLDDSKWSLHRDIPGRWARLALFFLCGSWDLHLKLMSRIHLVTVTQLLSGRVRLGG